MRAVYVINNELNGIEIMFDGIPSSEIRDELKKNNFRWHRAKKIWYAKNNEARLEMAKKICGEKIGAEKNEEKSVLGVKVGDIFMMSRGYDQTNVDFFQVIKICGKKSVRIRQVYLPIEEETNTFAMSCDRKYKVVNEILPAADRSVHINDQENGDLKRVCGNEENPYLNMTSYANAYPYHGEQVYESWYA